MLETFEGNLSIDDPLDFGPEDDDEYDDEYADEEDFDYPYPHHGDDEYDDEYEEGDF